MCVCVCVCVQVKRSRIPKAGLGVFYTGKFPLPVGTHFGPYEGVKTHKEEAEESGYSWVVSVCVCLRFLHACVYVCLWYVWCQIHVCK